MLVPWRAYFLESLKPSSMLTVIVTKIGHPINLFRSKSLENLGPNKEKTNNSTCYSTRELHHSHFKVLHDTRISCGFRVFGLQKIIQPPPPGDSIRDQTSFPISLEVTFPTFEFGSRFHSPSLKGHKDLPFDMIFLGALIESQLFHIYTSWWFQPI